MLFDDNLEFIDLQMNPNNNEYMNSFDNYNNDKLVSTKEGFMRGNMFKDEYIPYKNYDNLKIVAKNEREVMLLEVMELCFAIIDLELYLDVNPNDTVMLKKYNELVEKSAKKELEYVKKYGPLELIDSDNATKFEWIDNPWPWDNSGGVKYV